MISLFTTLIYNASLKKGKSFKFSVFELTTLYICMRKKMKKSSHRPICPGKEKGERIQLNRDGRNYNMK